MNYGKELPPIKSMCLWFLIYVYMYTCLPLHCLYSSLSGLSLILFYFLLLMVCFILRRIVLLLFMWILIFLIYSVDSLLHLCLYLSMWIHLLRLWSIVNEDGYMLGEFNVVLWRQPEVNLLYLLLPMIH